MTSIAELIAARHVVDTGLGLAKDLLGRATWSLAGAAPSLADLRKGESELTDALALLQGVIERRAGS